MLKRSKFHLAPVLLAIVLMSGLAGTAHAERITVERIGAEELNIEAQGRKTFRSSAATIICNQTMQGHLNATTTGTLGLLRNEAGTLRDIRWSNCAGGTFIPLIRLESPETWIRLSWLRAERGVPGRAEFAANHFNFLIEISGVSCLYEASLTYQSTSDATGNYRTLELRTLSIRLVSGGIFCPSEMILAGSVTLTRPTSIRIRLE